MLYPGSQGYNNALASSTSIDAVLDHPFMRSEYPADSRPETANEKVPTPGRRTPTPINPFYSPYSSNTTRAPTPTTRPAPSKSFFRSRRVKKGDVQKPWTESKDAHEKWVTIIALIGILAGLAIAGLLVWDGLRGVVTHRYCSVYETDFAEGLDMSVWTKEAEVGGFGNGQFEQTTDTNENVFVADGVLNIKPTLQDPRLINEDNVIDLRKDGLCSSDVWSNCITATNTTNGTIIQPAKSGRISTKKGARIRYGRIEVTAKIPSGDWLWPAIWMLPADAKYGPWPASGEIDIMESRGNQHGYAQGGNNIMSSTLHYGPRTYLDAWWRHNLKRNALHTTYAEKYHTFGLEWSEKYLFTYIDNRLLQVLYVNFDSESLWDRGDFGLSDVNGTRLVDPWSQTGVSSTPFDQEFYLILNVAVGGTNGWFQDGRSGKPWVDTSDTSKKDFWNARDEWLPTWQDNGAMQIKSVRMWQQEGYGSCPVGKGERIK